jgi:tetratricopeptide (TPR) repeat protein
MGDYVPIDTRGLPANSKQLESAEIINSEIANKTYRSYQFREATYLDHKSALAWFNRGLAAIRDKEYGEARYHFHDAKRLEPNDPRFYEADIIASFCEDRLDQEFESHYAKAIANYDQLIERFGNTAEATWLERAEFNKNLIVKELRARLWEKKRAAAPTPQKIISITEKIQELSDIKERSLEEELSKRFLEAESRRTSFPKEIADYFKLLLEFHNAIDSASMSNDEGPLGPFVDTLMNKGVSLGVIGTYQQTVADATKAHLMAWGPNVSIEDYSAYVASYEKFVLSHGLMVAGLARYELSLGHFNQANALFRYAVQCNPDVEKDIKNFFENYFLKFYNMDNEEENPSNGYDLPKRIITEADLRKFVKEQAAFLTERLSQPNDAPFPILDDRTVKAIVGHGKKCPWDDRKKRGWPYHTNVFLYVQITYRKWINRGLTREILKSADAALYANLIRKISLEGLPKWLDLPTGPEARARAITDPVERAELEIVRKHQRRKWHEHVQRKPSR